MAYLKSYEATIRLGKTVFANPDAFIPVEVPEELVQALLLVKTEGKIPVLLVVALAYGFLLSLGEGQDEGTQKHRPRFFIPSP